MHGKALSFVARLLFAPYLVVANKPRNKKHNMSRKNKENMTYAEAMSELELIVAALEDEQTGVDELADKVKTASDLLVFCRNKLRATEEAINSTLENTNNQ